MLYNLLYARLDMSCACTDWSCLQVHCLSPPLHVVFAKLGLKMRRRGSDESMTNGLGEYDTWIGWV